MDKTNDLVEYMQKLKNMADFLARGYILQSLDDEHAIEITDDKEATRRNAFSLQEYSLYDELEVTFFGEQRSIGILMEYINNGEYERQVQGKIDFHETYKPKPEEAEFYRSTMKRINTVLKTMALSLVFGSTFLLDDDDFKGLKEGYLDEEELETYEDETKGCLVYDTERQCFCVKSLDGETIIECVGFDVGMEIYNDFLFRQEQDELRKMTIGETEKEASGEDERE